MPGSKPISRNCCLLAAFRKRHMTCFHHPQFLNPALSVRRGWLHVIHNQHFAASFAGIEAKTELFPHRFHL